MRIWSYLGYIEMREMISSRLTKFQKAEILESYRSGESTNSLAEKYNCTMNTINRTVKTLLSDSQYQLLKEQRSKISKKKSKMVENETVKKIKEELEHSDSLISVKEKLNDEDLNEVLDEEFDEEFDNSNVQKIDSLAIDDDGDFVEENNLELIAPLISSFDFETDKQKSVFQLLHYETLPESVYMIVDKKVELDSQRISDLSEWSFLPENELQRNAILLFSNQRSAKRNCSKNQRVIKIPNTSIFKLSKSYLISKGITRLILEDNIIALDN